MLRFFLLFLFSLPLSLFSENPKSESRGLYIDAGINLRDRANLDPLNLSVGKFLGKKQQWSVEASIDLLHTSSYYSLFNFCHFTPFYTDLRNVINLQGVIKLGAGPVFTSAVTGSNTTTHFDSALDAGLRLSLFKHIFLELNNRFNYLPVQLYTHYFYECTLSVGYAFSKSKHGGCATCPNFD